MGALSYGEIIRRGRERAGLSQRALARAAGVDCSGLARVESGERPPFDEGTSERVAGVLKVSRWRLAAAVLRRVAWPEAARALDGVAEQDECCQSVSNGEEDVRGRFDD